MSKQTKKTTGKKKTTKKKAATKANADKPMSGLDAAAKVLKDVGEPMSAKQIVEAAMGKGLWQTNGATPHATIYSAMIREIAAKRDDARFKKIGRGQFAANG